MRRIQHTTAVGSLPPVPALSGTLGFFTVGNPVAGVPATVVPDWWLNMIQEDLMDFLEAAGLPEGTPTVTAATALFKAGRLLNVQVFGSSGTYVPIPGMVTCIAEIVGAGGAGGGGFATSGSTFAVGSGGASGSFARVRLTAAQIGASVAVTVGAAGSPVAGAAGGPGGSTSFGALITCAGGLGGDTATTAVGSTAVSGQGGPGIAPSIAGGTVLASGRGQPGSVGLILPTVPISGQGAPSPVGGGGGPNTAGGLGGAATTRGAGGGGSANLQSQGNTLGGPGSAGQVVVWEFS